MSDTNVGSTVAGMMTTFAVGAMVGAGVALLYAPGSGKETRELVSGKMRDLKDAAGEALEDGKQKAHDMFGKGKEAIREIGSSSAARSA